MKPVILDGRLVFLMLYLTPPWGMSDLTEVLGPCDWAPVDLCVKIPI